MHERTTAVRPAPGVAVVRRSVTIAALWSMVASVVGAMVVVSVGLIVAAVVGIAWLVSSGEGALADFDVVWQAARVATWVVAALVIAVSVWVAAYSSTEWGSRPRAVPAIGGAAVATTAYFLLGSAGLVLAGLGMGWAIAIPAGRIGRVAARAVVCLLAGLVVPSIDRLSGGTLAAVLVASPWGAALLCWVADGLWTLTTRRLPAPLDG
jgi:hypothetical protein